MNTKTVNEIAEFNEFESKLAEYTNKFKGIVYDLSDEEQKKSAKSDKKAISKSINELDTVHKSVKSELLIKTKLIDGERKRIKDKLLILKDDITKQEEEFASIAIKHAAMLHEKVTDIENYALFDIGEVINFERVKASLKLAVNCKVDSSFEAREADGHMAKAKAIESLEAKIALFEKQERIEKEEKELAEKAQQEREEQIRKDAEAIAAKEKEAAALKAKNDAETAKKKAEADKKAAVKEAQEKAEAAAKEKEAAARIEVERLQALADDEAKKLKDKQENQSHRAKIHKQAKESLISLGKVIDEETAIIIVKAIASDQIKNVTINY